MEINKNIFENKKFKKIILPPPNHKPGSFKGAGDLLINSSGYWLTSRSRTKQKRGYEVEIFHSKEGYNYKLIKKINIKQLEKNLNTKLSSIEGQQILYHEKEKLYYLYISVDFGDSNGHLWKTILMTTKNPSKDWENKGVVIEPVKPFNTAKDFNISNINGLYIGLCKAYIDTKNQLKAALFTSKEGLHWKYIGVPLVDNKKQPKVFALDGKFYKLNNQIFFIGSLGNFFENGLTASDRICGYELNLKTNNLKTIFIDKWKVKSKYERLDYPLHTYCAPVFDHKKNEFKIIAEAIDPRYTKKLGVFDVVDNVIMFTSKV
ncbi:MAG: hypothetical protein ACP5MV_01005 [Candidatus Parvarchaeum sp.]